MQQFKQLDYIPFYLDNSIKSFLDFSHWQRREAETRASALDGRDDFVDIIAYNAESNVLGVLLNDSSQSGLCLRSHHISFIEDNELISIGKQSARLCKILDLLAYDIDPTIVRCVELCSGRG